MFGFFKANELEIADPINHLHAILRDFAPANDLQSVGF
jgi:hypothetical protein